MRKITAILLATVIIGGLAPAVMASEDEHTDEPTFDAGQTATLIGYEGFSVTRVERWGEYVRAFLSDGTMAYFDPDTLRPVMLPY